VASRRQVDSGTHLGIGEKATGKRKLWPAFSFFIVGGERGGVVPVPHISDSQPTACRPGGNVAQHRSPILGRTHAQCGRFEADPGHCFTRSGPNH
jgi:hypothetical protein